MTKQMQGPDTLNRPIRIAAISFAGALALALTPAAAANAQTAYWPPVESACGSNYVQLKFVVTGTSGTVHVGYSDRDSGYGNGPFWSLHHGTNTIETGFKTVWWQKWSNTGNANISHYTTTCVNFT